MRCNSTDNWRVRLILCAIFFAISGGWMPLAQAQSPAKLKAEEEAYREYMQTISRQLGVTCNTCHDVKNWKSDTKPSYKVAREHIRIVQLLIDNGMGGTRGAPKADCYLCHRGLLKPAYKEPNDPLIMNKTEHKSSSGDLNTSEDDKE